MVNGERSTELWDSKYIDKMGQLMELRSHGDTLFVAPLEPAGRLSRLHAIENDIIQMYVM